MGRSRYWIYDEDETPMRLPLGILLQRLREQYPNAERCEISRSEGYGEQINDWDERLDTSDRVIVALSLLQRICTDGEEWFYHLDAVLLGHDIRFGLHDSTALFVEGERASTEALVSGFSDVRPPVGQRSQQS